MRRFAEFLERHQSLLLFFCAALFGFAWGLTHERSVVPSPHWYTPSLQRFCMILMAWTALMHSDPLQRFFWSLTDCLVLSLPFLAGVLFALMLGAQVLSPVYHTAYTWSGISQVNLERLAHIGFGALAAVFYPNIPIANLFTFGGEYIGSVINYVCVVSVFLSLAVFTLSRKEFSYAQD